MVIPADIGEDMVGGMKMDAELFWQMFMETGSPVAYVMYRQARQMEGAHVLDGQRIDITGNQLQ